MSLDLAITFVYIYKFGLRWVGWLQRWADTNVTLAFEDAQVIPPFSREETDDTDYTDDTEEFLRTFWGLSEDILRNF